MHSCFELAGLHWRHPFNTFGKGGPFISVLWWAYWIWSIKWFQPLWTSLVGSGPILSFQGHHLITNIWTLGKSYRSLMSIGIREPWVEWTEVTVVLWHFFVWYPAKIDWYQYMVAGNVCVWWMSSWDRFTEHREAKKMFMLPNARCISRGASGEDSRNSSSLLWMFECHRFDIRLDRFRESKYHRFDIRLDRFHLKPNPNLIACVGSHAGEISLVPR